MPKINNNKNTTAPITAPITTAPITTAPIVKSKRGRKSKAELIAALNAKINIEQNITLDIVDNNVLTEPQSQDILNLENDCNNELIKPPLKKRGRKPKGGKIVQHITDNENMKPIKPNIILHLKCSTKDLLTTEYNDCGITNYIPSNDLTYEFISKKEENKHDGIAIINDNDDDDDDDSTISQDKYNNDLKDVWKKLKQLQQNLHTNNINDKKSACFWCTCDFDNPPMYIPRYYVNDMYQVYGCFCSPECAVASLMEENIDSSTKFERYHFLNHIYAKIFNYTKNIKPAPNPYYLLNKFYGNLTIQEYRSMLRNERLFIVIDKPLTRILPELHEGNDDFILNNKIIHSNNSQIKKRQQNKNTKTTILNETFGINAMQ